MTDPEVPDLTQAQTTNDDDPATSAEFGPASANDTDSDDYDPSINVAENPSPPAQPSTNFPLIADQNVFPSPSYSALHPLPPRPDMLSSTHAGSAGHDPSTSVAPVQPKMKGGFEVDEDDLEAEEDNKDILDVYEPVDGTEGDASVQAPSDLVDSHSPSAKQANGVALTAPPQDAYKSTSTIVPSHLPVTAASPQRAVSVTPLPAATDTPAQVSSTSDNVTNPPAQTISKGRLAHDVVGILKDRIEEDPRGDFEAWVELIEELKSRNKQDDVRKTYEDLLKVFPICVRFLKIFLDKVLRFFRLNNGVHTCGGKNNTTTNSKWKISSNVLYWRLQMWNCGLSTSVISVVVIVCRLAMSPNPTGSLMTHLTLP